MITERKKKNYLKGSAKQYNFGSEDNYIINVDFLLSDLQKLPVNEAGYVKIVISKLKETDKYGNTHSIYQNEFVPDKSKAQSRQETAEPIGNPANLKKRAIDDLPF